MMTESGILAMTQTSAATAAAGRDAARLNRLSRSDLLPTLSRTWHKVRRVDEVD